MNPPTASPSTCSARPETAPVGGSRNAGARGSSGRSRAFDAVAIGLALACLPVGCRREPPGPREPAPSVHAEGPRIEVRILRAPRFEVLLPRHARVSGAAGARLFEGNVKDGEDRVSAACAGEGISLGGWTDPGPIEVESVAADLEGDTSPRTFPGVVIVVASASVPAGVPGGVPGGVAADPVPPAGNPDPAAGAAAPPRLDAPQRRYRGILRIERAGEALELVNILSLEEYLAGVVGSEMPASSAPIEALKAQTVVARTYALYGILERVERGRPPRFAADEGFQVYGGLLAEHRNVLRAVKETTGEVLTYRGRLFRSYFHSTCGGRTARAGDSFREPPIEPLEGVICGACGASAFARWEATLRLGDVEAILRPWLALRGIELGTIHEILVSERSRDERARYVLVRHSMGSLEIRARTLRALFRASGLRSEAFDVERAGDTFVFRGAGWGHGVGLCQVGAMRWGEAESCGAILAHYYPGSAAETVYGPFAERPGGAGGVGSP